MKLLALLAFTLFLGKKVDISIQIMVKNVFTSSEFYRGLLKMMNL